MATLDLKNGNKLKGIDYGGEVAPVLVAKMAPLINREEMSPHYSTEQIADQAVQVIGKLAKYPFVKEDVLDWPAFMDRINRTIKKINGVWSYRHPAIGWVKVKIDRITPVEAQLEVFKVGAEPANNLKLGFINKVQSTGLLTGQQVDPQKFLA